MGNARSSVCAWYGGPPTSCNEWFSPNEHVRVSPSQFKVPESTAYPTITQPRVFTSAPTKCAEHLGSLSSLLAGLQSRFHGGPTAL
jgi:hypothetical protein